jgi:hypothetical protein
VYRSGFRDQSHVLKHGQRWVDDPRTWGIFAPGEFLDCTDQLVPVARFVSDQFEQDQAQFARSEHPPPAPSAAAAATPAKTAIAGAVAKVEVKTSRAKAKPAPAELAFELSIYFACDAGTEIAAIGAASIFVVVHP